MMFWIHNHVSSARRSTPIEWPAKGEFRSFYRILSDHFLEFPVCDSYVWPTHPPTKTTKKNIHLFWGGAKKNLVKTTGAEVR